MFSRVALVTVVVRDYEEAVSFYCNAEFKVVKDVTYGEGKRWIELQISESADAPKISLAEGKTVEMENPVMVLEVDDIYAYQKRLLQKIPDLPPPQEDHGRVGMLLSDPSGNKLYIRQQKKN